MITREDVLHIAKLARLQLSEEQIALFQEQLGKILGYFQELEKLDTSSVPPMTHVLDLSNVLRPDEPRPSLSVEEALRNAPRSREGYFEVPRIVEKT
ncbi:MAG: Asp-tRNA(Asn)/Glu-tRNA(Gln) amidotransferase subunit GatC [Candidatus Bipolaricaulota bacterium]|nr:Asp-tRNA(Asn)/Glu-tRNA(Gln) amidotransferase subunit GatC [Candidatus Bipolaricaulota bacterium]MCS7274257.1 Asp-tRNA(Asn)/Glu-tRNA(Gln) amidotransferase subunit GatC [Candidatus Bipolaricaulota bacterium]MDW8111041.1 Asp-tRNA(Asn)/Glu-tRNA(Gln) amidotransferase subunit GatC [Candidatus Bipolaricaulota bacterium]MDW8329772.1 Asp-tRNA(Asn)/Glu-tRNA(Gln) amidotransferase subunit GatC [Candidatus Bipolaricaulota bacterium]